MSDDTPTQRIPGPGDGDMPTQRLDTGEVQEDLQEEKQKSKGLLIGLVAAGGLLLLAIVVIAFFLLNRGQGDPVSATDTPSATATPTPGASDTPSATPTPTEDAPAPPPPPQEPSGPSITSFKVSPATVYCNTQAPVQPQNQYLSMSWATTGADQINIGTYDPYGDYSVRYYNLPPSGNQGSIGQDIIYQCPEATQTWRLEIIADGQTYMKEVTIHNDGDQQ